MNTSRRPDPAAWVARFDQATGRLLATQPPRQAHGISLFFSGHVSNLKDVARELGCAAPQGMPATESVLCAAWRRWGDRLAQHVLGAYAVALIDHRHATVTLLQDALGLQTIFYAHQGHVTHVADTLAGLLAALGKPALCLDYFAAWLRHGYGLTDRTPYEGVRRLVHGSHVRIAAGQVRHGATALPIVAAPSRSLTRNDAEHALVAEVRQAVARECATLNNPLFELSGGLDSSTVVAMARDAAGTPPAVITWASAHDDDARFAALVSARLGLRQRVIARPPTDFIDWDGLHRWTEPGNEFSGTLRATLHDVLGNDHDGIVTGVGGDDVFHARGMRPYWLADLVRAGRFGQAYHVLRAPPPAHVARRSIVAQLWRFGLRPLFAHGADAAFTPQYRYQPRFMERCLALPPAELHLPDDDSRARRDFFRNIRALVANRVAISHLSPEIRFRHPLLSLPLVTLSAALLGRFEHSLYADRTLQRTGFAAWVPEAVLQRQSKGGTLAQEAAYWRSDDARRRFASDDARVVELGLVDAAQWRSLLAAAGFGRFPSLREFDFVMKTEIWLRAAAHAPVAPVRLTPIAPPEADMPQPNGLQKSRMAPL